MSYDGGEHETGARPGNIRTLRLVDYLVPSQGRPLAIAVSFLVAVVAAFVSYLLLGRRPLASDGLTVTLGAILIVGAALNVARGVTLIAFAARDRREQ